MTKRLGAIIMSSGIAIILILGWWALHAYGKYTDCVRQKISEVDKIFATSQDFDSSAHQAAIERAALGCSTNGMETAGAGVVIGFVVFVTGVVKSFLDKKSAEIVVQEGDRIMGDKKVEVSVGDGTVIHGDFVVANSIKGSFNKIDSAELPGNLKKSLKELSVAVGKMSEKLDKEDAEKVAQDLQTLVAEATSEKPRRKWWELSIEGLKEAAKNIGEVGKPVIELAAQVAVILAGMR